MVALCVFRTLTGPKAYLDHLVVAPEWQRRGIGRALVGRAIQEARASGASRIDLTASDRKVAVRSISRLAFRSGTRGPSGFRCEAGGALAGLDRRALLRAQTSVLGPRGVLSRSLSVSASVSLIRSPARHITTISPRNRMPMRAITGVAHSERTISSTVGGSAG